MTPKTIPAKATRLLNSEPAPRATHANTSSQQKRLPFAQAFTRAHLIDIGRAPEKIRADIRTAEGKQADIVKWCLELTGDARRRQNKPLPYKLVDLVVDPAQRPTFEKYVEKYEALTKELQALDVELYAAESVRA